MKMECNFDLGTLKWYSKQILTYCIWLVVVKTDICGNQLIVQNQIPAKDSNTDLVLEWNSGLLVHNVPTSLVIWKAGREEGFSQRFQKLRLFRNEIETQNQEEIPYTLRIVQGVFELQKDNRQPSTMPHICIATRQTNGDSLESQACELTLGS